MDTQQLLEAVQILSVVKELFEPQHNEYLPVISAVVGAAVGAIASIVPNLYIERRRSKHEKTAVSNALVSEIRSLLTIVKYRRYLEEIDSVIEYLRANPSSTYTFIVKVPDHYSRVYQAHSSRIGLIEPLLASRIIEFHQLVDAVIQDIIPSGHIAQHGGNLEAFEQLRSILSSAIALGKEIVASFNHEVTSD